MIYDDMLWYFAGQISILILNIIVLVIIKIHEHTCPLFLMMASIFISKIKSRRELFYWFVIHMNPFSPQYGDLLPWNQSASTSGGNDVGGPLNDIIGPEKVIQCLGQGHIPGYPWEIRNRTTGPTSNPTVQGQPSHGGMCERILWHPLQDIPGVTQSNTISPKLFNIVDKNIVKHWLTILSEWDTGTEVFDCVSQWMSSF